MGIFGKTDQKTDQKRPEAVPSYAPPTSTAAIASPSRGVPAPAPSAPATTCLIGPKTQVKGEITGDENVVVEGRVEGTVRITRDLTVGPGGTVKATVQAQSIVVAGELLGDAHAAHRVQIEARGKMTGNIRAPRVVIAEGATFRGSSDMSPRKEGEA